MRISVSDLAWRFGRLLKLFQIFFGTDILIGILADDCSWDELYSDLMRQFNLKNFQIVTYSIRRRSYLIFCFIELVEISEAFWFVIF